MDYEQIGNCISLLANYPLDYKSVVLTLTSNDQTLDWHVSDTAGYNYPIVYVQGNFTGCTIILPDSSQYGGLMFVVNQTGENLVLDAPTSLFGNANAASITLNAGASVKLLSNYAVNQYSVWQSS